MLTTDLALRVDPAYEAISRRFQAQLEQFADAFARAWFKLIHRDMGPRARYLGPEVFGEELLWQDTVPAMTYAPVDAADIELLRAKIAASSLSASQLVSTAWASASTFRSSDKRGGKQISLADLIVLGGSVGIETTCSRGRSCHRRGPVGGSPR